IRKRTAQRARDNMFRVSWVGDGEAELGQYLAEHGVITRPQFPDGVYNIDLAASPTFRGVSGPTSVAVEVHRQNNLPASRPKLLERIDYLSELWHVVYVVTPH